MSLPFRSLLFVPANRPDRFDKALSSGAHVIIIDLEDAVSPDNKSKAREFVAAWLSPERGVYIRVNGADTPWFRDDFALASSPGVVGVMLPKSEGIDEVLAVANAGTGVAVLPIIESAEGLNKVREIARAPGVYRLVFGSIDFQLDMGITGNDTELLPYRSQIVLASRLAGLVAPVDGVTTAIDDMVSLRTDSFRARRLGFGGKLCIHPDQVDVVNACFGPSDEELAWANRVLEASRLSGGDAVLVDGKMVDRPIVMRARIIIQEVAARSCGQPVPRHD